MSESLFQSLFMGVFSIIMLIMWVIIPFVSRESIFLGVRIPEEKRNTKEIAEIKTQFIISSIIVGLIYTVISAVVVYKMDENSFATFSILSIFLYLFVLFIVYYIFNRKTVSLKKKNGWTMAKKQVVSVDTKFTIEKSKNYIVSSVWFLIPVLIIVGTIIINAIVYPNIPQRVPMHYNFKGQITGYQIKSQFLIFEMPLIELFLTAIMLFSNKMIGWAKQEIDPQKPEESKQRNILFRRAWSIYIFICTILLDLLFSVGDLQIINVIKFNGFLFIIPTFSIAGVMIAWSIYLSIKYGQGGSKLKLGNGKENDYIANRDDDKYWKIGNIIYYNPDDPAVFIEKRVGIGWTVNAGRPLGMFFYIVIVVIIIGCMAIPFFIKK